MTGAVEQANARWRPYRDIVLSVASYWACSIGLVFLNKHLLSGAGAKLDVPLFITWCQCCTTVGICSALQWGARIVGSTGKFPRLGINVKTCKDVLPLSVVFVAMISSNNVCLKHVGVSFYYIGRSLTTVFNVMLSYMMLGEKSSLQTISACLLIVCGFILGVDQEDVHGSMSVIGTVSGVLASLAVASNAIYTKKVLPKVADCIWTLTWYNNLNALVLFVPLMVINGDLAQVLETAPDSHFWRMLLLSGVFGFAMNYVTGWQIQATSPLTHNISATAKSAAQTVMAVFLYSEVKTFLWWNSNLIVLIGSALYTFIRKSEMDSKTAKQKTK